MPLPFRGASPRALLLALAASVAAACSDTGGDAPLVGPGDAAPAGYIAHQPDPAINPSDTYYLMEMWEEGSTTVNSPHPIIDPVTGVATHSWTVQHVPEVLRVEGGYDAWGQIIQVVDQIDPMADPLLHPVNTTRRTRSVEEVITRFDGQRQVMPNDPMAVQPYAHSGPSHEQITDGLLLDAPAVDALGSTLSPSAEPLVRATGPRARVERTGAETLRIVNDIGSGREPAVVSAQGRGSVQPDSGSYVRTYRRRGNRYVLEEVELTAHRRSAGGGETVQRQVQRVRTMRFHENPRRDRERREKRGGMHAMGGGMDAQAIQWQDPFIICPLAVGAECGGGGYYPPPPPPDPCPRVDGAVHLLFQHGIMSSGQTWERMDGWMRCSFRTDRHIRPSINWFPAIDSQRDELVWHLPGQPVVLIGHSNGGLVSRSLAQWAQSHRPGQVRGVVTLDSPNQGAIVARNARALEYAVGTLLFGGGWLWFDALVWHPFYEDDVPGSPFLNRINSFPEGFTRVGIQTHTPKRWVAWRILRTPDHCVPESHCGERAVARQTQEAYDRHRHYARFWYRPWQSIPAATSMLVMNGLDAAWNGLTAPSGLTTDGFIHGPGQVYPNAQRNQLIRNGDSHVGTTRSPFVRDELSNALRDPFLFAIPVR